MDDFLESKFGLDLLIESDFGYPHKDILIDIEEQAKYLSDK